MRGKKINLATDSIILIFVQCVTLVTGIIQTMILSRVLTQVEYGTYSQGVLIINFITPFLLLGLNNGINYFYNQEKAEDEIKRYVDTTFSIVMAIGGITGIAIIFFRKWICFYFNNDVLYPLLIFIAFRPLLKNIISLYQPLYISNSMAKIIAIRNLAVGVIQVGIIGVFLFFSKNLLLLFLLLLILDFAQVCFFKWGYERRYFKISFFKIDKEIAPEICRYALPLALAVMVGTLSINMDKMLIGRMLSTEEFAVYSNMAKELPFSFIVASLTTVVTPVLIRLKNTGQIEEMKKLWSRYIEAGVTVTWILVAGALLCGKEMIIFLYSEKYIEGYWIFIIYLLVTFMRFTYFGMILTVYGKTRQVLYFSCATLFSNLILNYVFIHWLGLIGPAVATLIAITIMNSGQMIYSLQLLHAKWLEVFNLKRIGILIAEMVVTGIGLYFIKAYIFVGIKNNTAVLFFTYMFFVGTMMIVQFKNLKRLFLELNAKE